MERWRDGGTEKLGVREPGSGGAGEWGSGGAGEWETERERVSDKPERERVGSPSEPRLPHRFSGGVANVRGETRASHSLPHG
jgi:hypothetical protein